jgi:LysR family transcriptional regulator, glycine cleavage system transcriptional activator
MNTHHEGGPSSQVRDDLPPLSALRCFEAAARHESFTKAAEELHLTHGAISRAVRAIEDQLGVELFDRRNRAVFLNDAGRRLAEVVSNSFSTIGVTARDLRRRAARPAMVVSCEPTLLMRWLIPALPDLQAKHPEIALQLIAACGSIPFEREGIDVAIRRNDFGVPDTADSMAFMDEYLGPVCSPQLAARLRLSQRGTEALADATLLQTRARPDSWKAWFSAHGADHAALAHRGETFEHFYFTLQAAAAGLGVAIGSYFMVKEDLKAGVLVAPLGFAADGSRYCLLSPRPIRQDPGASDLLRWLREKAQRDLADLITGQNHAA